MGPRGSSRKKFILPKNQILGNTLKINAGPKIVFLSMYGAGYSRSGTLYSELVKRSLDVSFHQIAPKNLVRSLRKIRAQYPRDTMYIVASPSQYLTLFARLTLGKNIFLDAGWSLFEGTVLSRGRIGILGFVAIKNYLIDFVASHVSRKVFLESRAQLHFYSKLFLVHSSKLVIIFTGVDESALTVNLNDVVPRHSSKNIILFRGKFNPEAGIEVLAKATHLLADEDIEFWVYCPGLPSNVIFSDKTYVDVQVHPKSVIASLLKECTLSLGQLSNHHRLFRTIPHKAFEAAFLGTPYLTARNAGILELFRENFDIMCFDPNNAEDLSQRILDACFMISRTKEMGKTMNRTYQSVCSQKILGDILLKELGIDHD